MHNLSTLYAGGDSFGRAATTAGRRGDNVANHRMKNSIYDFVSVHTCNLKGKSDEAHGISLMGDMVIFKISQCARGINPGVPAHAYGSY